MERVIVLCPMASQRFWEALPSEPGDPNMSWTQKGTSVCTPKTDFTRTLFQVFLEWLKALRLCCLGSPSCTEVLVILSPEQFQNTSRLGLRQPGGICYLRQALKDCCRAEIRIRHYTGTVPGGGHYTVSPATWKQAERLGLCPEAIEALSPNPRVDCPHSIS